MCGVRGSTPAVGGEFVRYGGHTSCVALAHDDAGPGDGAPGSARPTLILDAGTGLQAASKLLGGATYDGTIVLSHLDWDHTLGLQFFSAGRSDLRTYNV
jgi:phosphoribosyl 1,2-cyclic phosphodiesterase